MVVGLLSAIVAGPAILGITEGVRVGQTKNKKEEHRGRRCNLIVNHTTGSSRGQEVNGKQIVLQNGKTFVNTTEGACHPFEGYYLPYPGSEGEGLVSSIDDRQPPMLNWVYVDVNTYEVKYGVRADAQPNLTTPFDCTPYDRRLTLQGWEGFVAVEEQAQSGVWGLYYDGDRDGFSRMAKGRHVLQIQLTRTEKRQSPIEIRQTGSMTYQTTQPQTQEAQQKAQAIKENNERLLKFRTGALHCPDFRNQKSNGRVNTYDPTSQVLQVTFNPPFESTPSVVLGLNQIEEDNTKNMRLEMNAYNITKDGFTAEIIQWNDSTIYEVGASWFATTDPGFQMGNFNTSQVRPMEQATQSTKMRINFNRSFDKPPEMKCWLHSMDLPLNIYTGARFRVCVTPEDIDTTGFTIHAYGWNDSQVNNAGCCWIAFPSGKKGVQSGWQNATVSADQSEKDSFMKFPDGMYSKAPGRVKMAMYGFDLGNQFQTNLKTGVTSVGADGLHWKTNVSPQSPAEVSVSFLALDD